MTSFQRLCRIVDSEFCEDNMNEALMRVLSKTYSRAKEVSVAHLLFYGAFSLYSICTLLELTTFNSVMGMPLESFVSALQMAALVLLVIKFFTQRATLVCWCAILAATVVGFVSWRQGGEGWFFWLVVFVVCSEGINIRTLAAITLGIAVSLTVFTVLCCATGLIENRLFIRTSSVRYGWGFWHPNYFASYLTLICISFSTLRFNKNPAPDMLLIVSTLIINLAFLDSRSNMIMAIAQVLMLVIFFNTKGAHGRRVWSTLFLVALSIVIAGSLYFMFMYNDANPMHNRLNEILSLRLSLSHGYYQMQPLSAFGNDYSGFQPIYWENGEPAEFLVDNAFCHLILRAGVVPMILFLIGLYAILIKMIKTARWDYLLFGIVLMALAGFAETLGIRVAFNYFLISVGAELLFNERPNKRCFPLIPSRCIRRLRAWICMPIKCVIDPSLSSEQNAVVGDAIRGGDGMHNDRQFEVSDGGNLRET